MKLRDHPHLVSDGVTIWPPVWVCPNDSQKSVKGEVGILKDVGRHDLLGKYFFVYMVHDKVNYRGCLLFDDHTFGTKLFDLLKACQISDMEVSRILPS